ncbi:diacylglycerol/polyprenol kinase family protein [Victivallis sp. Marseille-Q1083]|uniref:diacylglycerol/polyprenol kinase family protein n=1 Tax=Victivallis sp. Marseille-Q1083 TaxID=2717288 RepID=UPI00158ED87F|nr:hypothetical protein [Victivallis sp. Marseille-Q1083]
MNLLRELAGIGLVGVLFLSLFLLGELLRKIWHLDGELTRKFVHFGGCAVAMLFPLLLSSQWSVFLLGIVFSLLIYLSARRGKLQSIHGVERKTLGGIYHPIAIYLCFLICSLLNKMVFYEIAIMVLALSDSMAALVGKSYGQRIYRVERDSRKSLEGSIIFFLLTFLVVHLSLLLLTGMGRLESVLTALLIAILVTLFEAISLGGADNLFVPLGTVFLLLKNVSPAIGEIGFQLLALALTALLLWLIVRPFRKIGFSGNIALILAAYTGWGLVDFYWMLPILYGVLLICRTGWIVDTPEDPEEVYRVQPAFYLVVVPVGWVLAANLAGKLYTPAMPPWFFPPYAAALVGQLAILRLRKRLAHRRDISAGSLWYDTVLLWLFPAALFPVVFQEFSVRIILLQLAALATALAAVFFYRYGVAGKRLTPALSLRLRMSLVLVSSIGLGVLSLFAFCPERWWQGEL